MSQENKGESFLNQQQEQQQIEKAKLFIKQELCSDSSGHDAYHLLRVAQLAVRIGKQEGANLFICELAALLHDIADEKLNASKDAGLQKVQQWLEQQEVEQQDSAHIIHIINTMSYSGGQGEPMSTLEGQVVQDADRLDALGAIGIARTFAYAGWKGHLIYDPEHPPRESMTKREYREGKSTAVNHFYEKLLKLKNLMNTPYAQELAQQRHRYMEGFLEQFYAEWEAKDGIE